MTRYVLTRIGQALLVLWAAYTLSFLLLSALPGDAVNNRIQNPEAQLSAESAQALVAYYGLDQPLWRQYLSSLRNLLHGDLGYSITNGQSVSALIGDVLPSTLVLAAFALAVGIALAAAIGVLAHYVPWAWLRGGAAAVPALFASVPTFVVGILFIQYFSFRFGLIPATDDGTALALVGPAVTLGILIAAPLAQVAVTAIGQTRDQPFVHVLRARGAGERYLFAHGVLRNSSLPVITLLGLAVGELIAGSVVTEAVFARSGIGQLTVGAVATQDLPVLQGVVIVATVAYVTANLLVDLAYPALDPRLVPARGSAEGERRRIFANLFSGRVGAQPSAPVLPAEVAMP